MSRISLYVTYPSDCISNCFKTSLLNFCNLEAPKPCSSLKTLILLPLKMKQFCLICSVSLFVKISVSSLNYVLTFYCTSSNFSSLSIADFRSCCAFFKSSNCLPLAGALRIYFKTLQIFAPT